MSDDRQANIEHLFHVLCTLSKKSAELTDIHRLINETLHIYLNELALSGAVVWLRASERDMLTPGGSRLPPGCSTSAISESNELLQDVVEKGSLTLDHIAVEPLVLLPEGLSITLVPIGNEEALLGLVGYIASSETLASLNTMLRACADILTPPTLMAWLRRQQAEADDVADTLFRFAGELRAQRNLDDIFGTLNNLALRVFNCDWSGVYRWIDDDEGGAFQPVQIMTRVGARPVEDEPLLKLQEHPVLELVISDSDLNSFRDLSDQPGTLPVYVERHGLRGLVLVPILHETRPMGMLSLGYLSLLTPLSSRLTDLAEGLARMVAVALDRTLARQEQEQEEG